VTAAVSNDRGEDKRVSTPLGMVAEDVEEMDEDEDDEFVYVRERKQTPSSVSSASTKSTTGSTPGATATPVPTQQNVNLASSSSSSAHNPASNDTFILDFDLVNSMSVREVKSIMTAYGIDHTGCLEKSEMIDRMRRSPKILIMGC
jgi:hypothetical protein